MTRTLLVAGIDRPASDGSENDPYAAAAALVETHGTLSALDTVDALESS